MRTRNLVVMVGLACASAVAMGLATRSSASLSTTTHTTSALVAEPVRAFTPPAPPFEVVTEKLPAPPSPNPELVDYLHASISEWVRLPDCSPGKDEAETKSHQSRCKAWSAREREEVQHAKERMSSIATDIAQAAAVETSPYFHDPLNAQMAHFVAALGFQESGFREYVDDGRCNDREWQKTAEGIHLTHIGGACDGTLAHSMWQIHTGTGLLLVTPSKENRDHDWMSVVDSINWGMSGLRRQYEETDQSASVGFGHLATAESITGKENRLLAIRTAWHMSSQALRYSSFRNLCGYTGENPGGSCPKGATRMEFAKTGWKKHPFVAPSTP
jgi:hypothetical protein